MADQVKISPLNDDEMAIARELLRKHELPEGSTFVHASDTSESWTLFMAVRPDGTLFEDATGEVPDAQREQLRTVLLEAHQVPGIPSPPPPASER